MSEPGQRPTAAPAERVLLEARGVTKRFGGLLAVNEVDFRLGERSIDSLIGPNGAGKTTFFNMVAGLYRPSEGQILVTMPRPQAQGLQWALAW